MMDDVTLAVPQNRKGEPDHTSLVGTAPTVAESERIQVLRGMTCCLVVIIHVIGTVAQTGMHVPDGSGWRLFSDLLLHFRMPLFAFIAGFAYAYRPVRAGQQKKFLEGKVLRLLLPLVFVATLYYLSENLHPNASVPPYSVSEMWRIYLFPYQHLWFLQTILLVFVVIVILETLHVLDTPLRCAVALGVTLVLPFYFAPQHDWFSITGTVRLLPFFIMGVGLNRFRHLLQHPALPWIATVVFILFMGKHWLGVFGLGERVSAYTPMASVIGASGALFLWRWMPRSRLLANIGNSSFVIFAYHVFFVASTRELLNSVGWDSHGVTFVLCFAAGVLGPIVMSTIVERVSIGRRIVLGRA
jgi:fucose 4-O-acetylase-like acetyltransferase